MKTFKILEVAVVAALMCVTFISCNKDGASNGDLSNQKKIVKFVESWHEADPEAFSLQYDDDGRLIRVTRVDENGALIDEMCTFIWGDDVIERTDEWSYSIILENGLIQSSTIESGLEYTYNKSNRVIELNYNNSEIKRCVWDGDKLVMESTTTYTYDETCRSGYSPLIGMLIDGGGNYWLSIAHPELIGARTNQLPATYRWDNASVGNYSYEFDAEGYVTKIIETNNGKPRCTYTLTWN